MTQDREQANDLLHACYCEEQYRRSQYVRVEGWWGETIPDIEWGTFYDDFDPHTVFMVKEPRKTGAWRCPVGCIMERLPPVDTEATVDA